MNKENTPIVATAMSYLLTSQPFFAVLLMELATVHEVSGSHHVEMAAANNKDIYINTDWAQTKTSREIAWTLAHEILHILLRHCDRSKVYSDSGVGPDGKPYNFYKMNMATDYVINGILEAASVGTRVEEALYDKDIGVGDQADDVYCKLPHSEGSKGSGDSGGSEGSEGRAGHDDHLQPEPGGDAVAQGQVRAAAANAASAAKAVGTLPGGLARLVEALMEPTLDWPALLRDFMVVSLGHDVPTWRRANRRRLVMPPYAALPGTQGHKVGSVAILVDTSGSITDGQLAAFMAEVSGVLMDAVPQEAKVFWVDTEVAGVDEVDECTDLLALTPKGGGGTALHVAFPTIEEAFEAPVDCCVILTDGCTDLDIAHRPSFPVMWCMTTEAEAPYGINVRLDG